MIRLQPLCLLVLLAAPAAQAASSTVFILSVSPASPSTYGQAVTLSAFVSPLAAPITITFLDGTTPIGAATTNANNTAILPPISSLSAGTHSLQATFPIVGGGTFGSNIVPYTVNKVPTSITVSSSPNPSTFGQTVTITATVTASLAGETGTVSFFDGATQLGAPITVNSSGVATFQTSGLAVGSHTITATYSGDAYFAVSSSVTTQAVNRVTGTTTLSSSPNPSVFGQTVTITVTVAAGATGNVSFFDSQTPLGTSALNSNGTATFQTSTLAIGDHNLAAIYLGDADHSQNTSNTVVQTVNRVSTVTTLSVSPNPANSGQTVTLTASVAPSSATGTVTFLDGTNPIGTATLSGGAATTTTSTLAAGSHSLTATYNGDANNSPSTSPTVTLNVGQTATSTSLAASPNPAAVGQTVTLTATVTPSSATGTVTFRDGTNPIGTATLSNGSATTTTASLAVGSHSLTAVYGGDTADSPSTSAPVTEIVKASTTTSLTASPNPATPGQTVTITATVAPSDATGTVTFVDGTNPIGTARLNNGAASLTTASLAAGSHSLTATYSGDGTFSGSSGAVTLVVGKASTTTNLTASPTSLSPGQSVTLTATVAPSNATGTVTFVDGTNPIGTAPLNNGSAVLTTTSLAAGSHSLTATYGGDSNFNGSTSAPVGVAVGQGSTATSLSVSPLNAILGQPVTLTATVTPSSASGTVTFRDGTNPIGTAPLNNGSAVLTTTGLAAGSHSLSATYGGDSNFNGSTSAPVGVAVGQGSTATSLSVSPLNAILGQPVTLTATVTPSGASGTVTFRDGTNPISTAPLTNGSATFTTSTLTVGSHTLTAVYSGDNTFSASTSNPIVEVINQAATATQTSLSVSPNPAPSGQPVSLNALVVPSTATGTVTFLDGGAAIGTATLVNGTATFTTSTLTVGSHSLTASYGGDNADSPSTSGGITEIINAPNGTVTLSAAPNPANFGQTVTLTITVSPASSTGTVTVFDSVTAGTVGGTATLSNGTATITTSTLKVGSHSLQAFYSGPNNLTGQSNFVTETINPAPTTTTLTVSPTFTMTAAVTPSGATGTVTFKDGSATLGTATLSNGTATFSVATLAPGSHTLTATYNGDGNFAPSTSNPVTVTPGLQTTTTTLTVSPTTSAPGQTVTLTATVSPSAATGTVTFLDGSATLGTATLNTGTATFTITTLTTGTHTLTASYGGDSSNGPSTSNAVTETVGTATRTALSVSPNPSASGQTVTLTAVVTPSTATGKVTFLDGSTTLGTANLSGGTATFTIATLTAGGHSLTASYGGDANNAPSTSTAVTQTVNPGTPLQISPGSIPSAILGVAYSQTFTASGGTPPLTWSLVSGTQDLTMTTSGNNGVLAGTPKTAGAFQLTVRVQDSLGQASAAVLAWTVNPALPPISITAPQPTTISDQPVPQASLGTGYPVALNATYQLMFTSTPSLGAGYTAVQFVTGGTTSPTIAIPANSTTPVNLPAVQLGSVAGTITVQLASLTVAGTSQTVPLPSPVPSFPITVPRLAPIIVPGSVKITSVTSSGFQVFLDASSTPRDLTSANVTFTAASGTTLNGTSFTISLTSAATPWFDPANATGVANGGALSLTLPFTFTGSTSALGTASVTLTNSVGTSAAVSGGQ